MINTFLSDNNITNFVYFSSKILFIFRKVKTTTINNKAEKEPSINEK